MSLIEIAVLVLGSLSLGGVAGAFMSRFLLREGGGEEHEYPHLVEELAKLPIPVSGFVLLREAGNGQFQPTGEAVPEGEDPHRYVMRRSSEDGVAYSAQRVDNTQELV